MLRAKQNETFTGFSRSVLAVYPTDTLLNKIDATAGVGSVVVVTEELERIRNWIQKWSAQDLGYGTRSSTPIEERLRVFLGSRITSQNIENMILVFSMRNGDLPLLIGLSKALSDGHKVDSDAIYDWLIWPCGFGHLMANDVAEIARGVVSTKD